MGCVFFIFIWTNEQEKYRLMIVQKKLIKALSQTLGKSSVS